MRLRTCSVVLQMANKTRVAPKVIIKNVIINVGKFIIHNELIVLVYDIDESVIFILRRPFLEMKGTLINFRKGILTMRLNNE